MKAYKYLAILLLFINHIIYPSGENAADKTKSFNVSPGGTLSLSVNSGEIRITTWDKNEVQVTARGLYEDDAAQFKTYQESNTINVRYNGGMSDPDDLIFLISTPVRFNQNLKTLIGDVSITGNVKGDVTVNTQGGDIQTGTVDGNSIINTSGGDIISGDITGNAELSTSGGDILIHDVKGTADLFTMGGDVTANNISQKVNIKTHGGDIRIRNSGGDTELFTFGGDLLAGNLNGNCKLTTYGGDIKIDGAKGKVSAKTNGGDLELLNITGSIEASTQSGDIIAELTPEGKEDNKIITRNGGIIFRIPDKAKAEIVANLKVRGSYDESDSMISSEFKSKSHEMNSRNIKDVYLLNGGGISIYLESTDSAIKIEKLTK